MEEKSKQPVSQKKSVQIVDNRPEIVEVREKHGSLYNAIPRMPVCMAIICCLFNIILPGFVPIQDLVLTSLVDNAWKNIDTKGESIDSPLDSIFSGIFLLKHGSLYNAIPRMPVCMAIICCLFNIILPGFGTLLSAFSVLCGAPTNIDSRMNAFCLNLLSAFLQMITFIVIVGWVWSILWGMNMVTLAMNWGEDKKTSYYCRRQSSIDVP